MEDIREIWLPQKKPLIKYQVTTTYKLHGNSIVNPNKFIGVNIRNELSLDKHIANIVGKGNKMLDFIHHNIEDCSKSVAYTKNVHGQTLNGICMFVNFKCC